MQDIFKIKESGSKMKTKAQKIAFIQQCADQLKNLPYDSTQLEKIRTFIREKATEYKVPVPSVDCSAHSAQCLRHTLAQCQCSECLDLRHIKLQNSVTQPFKTIQNLIPTITALNIPQMSEHINNIV